MVADQEQSSLCAAATLLRQAHSAVLATAEGGQPYASLVTPALDEAARPILLLSNLATHTGHLRGNPRCALFFEGAAATRNPQTTPRLCLIGVAQGVSAEAAREPYLRIHPYATAYAGFEDFSFWKLQVFNVKFIGGFAQAYDLSFIALQHEILKIGEAAPG